MLVSLDWLRRYVKTDLGPAEVGNILTSAGLTCDGIEEIAGDAVLELEITSNRSDCLSHIGVARELAALTGEELTLPDVDFAEGETDAGELCTVRVDEPDLCPRYTARVITGVRVGPSPDWLRKRLEAVGIRPVNNIVDVTNFVLMECGHPMHAFDGDRLGDHAIVVRRAAEGEKFVAIDHSEHALGGERLVIADAKRPVAIAGVMGGADTEVSESTTNVILEVAEFDPVSIRRTARAMNIFSESSYRFERRINREGIDWASRRACRLIAEIAGGEVARGIVDVGVREYPKREVSLRIKRIETVLGVAVGLKEAAEILQRLGMAVVSRAKDRLTVRVPNFRRDVEREIDLIEEVARIYGYDNIPSRTLVPACPAPPNRRECVLAETGQVFAAAGYFEAVSHTLSTDGAARLFLPGGNVEPLKVLDSSSAARASLRMSVVPGLLEAKRVNQDAGRVAVKFFEIANRFVPVAGQTLPDENARLAILADDDFFAVKGVLETLFDALGLAHHAAAFESTDAYEALVAGESAAIVLDGESLGFIGRVEASLAEQFGLDAAPVVAEVDFDRLVAAANLAVQFHALPQFPAVERDLAIVVEESVTWARVDAAVRSEGVAELEAVEFLDVYRGKQVPEGKKSIAFRMRFRSAAGTLTHEDVNKFQEKILARLQKSLAATLRA